MSVAAAATPPKRSNLWWILALILGLGGGFVVGVAITALGAGLVLAHASADYEQRLQAATAVEAARGLDIELPHAAEAVKTLAQGRALVIEIARDGSVSVGREAMTAQSLHQRLRAAAAKGPGRLVRIDADRGTPYQHVVRILDMLAFEGFKTVAFRTRD